MLDHGIEDASNMVKNIREVSEKCGVLIPIILEQRSIFYYALLQKR